MPLFLGQLKFYCIKPVMAGGGSQAQLISKYSTHRDLQPPPFSAFYRLKIVLESIKRREIFTGL